MSSSLTDASPVGNSKGYYLTINEMWRVDHKSDILMGIGFYLPWIYIKKNTSVSVLINARARRLVSDVNTINLPGDAALSEEQPVLG